MEFAEVISSVEGLREIIAPPVHFVTDKETDRLDGLCRDFISRSPFLLVASSDGNGSVDVSPKGDPPGFVRVLDDTTLAIPDRPGNHRADTFENVLRHPWVGLIFLIPGTKNTLRVRGSARIVRDQDLRESMAIRDKVPELALVVDVKVAYFHCAKCVIRSKLWQEGAWEEQESDATDPTQEDTLLARAMVEQGGLPLSVSEMQEIITDDEATRLY
jgi:PPOX class probable FMN-dependent enzyme